MPLHFGVKKHHWIFLGLDIVDKLITHQTNHQLGSGSSKVNQSDIQGLGIKSRQRWATNILRKRSLALAMK
jgi:hypothetical protein